VTPRALPLIPDGIPGELESEDRWVPWRWESRNGKWTKVLVNAASGCRASSTDPSSWSRFEQAVRYAQEKRLPGAGFVFTGSPFAGVDLDSCRDPETGRLEEWAREIAAKLHSYTEASPSGTGVKVFVRGALPPGRRRKGRIEMYDSGRFFAVTGHRLPDAPTGVMERTKELAALHRHVFGSPPAKPQHSRPADLPGGADLDDVELIRRAASAANGEKFARLWAGDTSGYADGGNAGHSEADLALCSLLAFWAGPDEERIDRLFRHSGLYRPKWERDDYRSRTIGAALASRDEFWAPHARRRASQRRGAVSAAPPKAAEREGVVRVG